MTISPPRNSALQEFPDSAELLIKEARRQTLRRRVRFFSVALVVVVASVASAVVFIRSSPAPKTKTTSPSTQIVAAPCAASALSLADRGSDVATGHWTQLFQLINESDHACSLTGYPKIALETAQGPDTTAVITDIKSQASIYIGDPLKGAVPSAELAAHGGRASFWIGGSDAQVRNQPSSSCRFASEVLVTPPGAGTALIHRVGNLAKAPFVWCENSIYVTPVLSGQSGSIPGEPLCIYSLLGPTTKPCKGPTRQ
jgi:hypothetical protein